MPLFYFSAQNWLCDTFCSTESCWRICFYASYLLQK